LETLPLQAVVVVRLTPQTHRDYLVGQEAGVILVLVVLELLDKEMLAQVLAL
jgi:hypothetical protein